MKLIDIEKRVVTTYEMRVSMPPGVNEFYTRHEDGEWTYDVSYDIEGATYTCDKELAEQLEDIFIKYKEFTDN